jgi:phage tail-like protein
MAVHRKNPYSAFNFRVYLDGTELASFMEVSGLDAENAVIEYRTGNNQPFVRKLPGLERYPNVILRRGITGNLRFWNDLRKKIRDGDIGPELQDPGSATPALKIDLHDEKQNVVQSWTLQNAWVSKLSGPSLNAKSNEIALETIEVVCDRIELS